MHQSTAAALFVLLLLLLFKDGSSTTFTVVNQCSYTVWPGLLSGAGTASLPSTGFVLDPSESQVFSIPAAWSGRMWARTLCAQNTSTGIFSCVTGDCGSSAVECAGSGPSPPATLAEFTLNGADGLDFYDVSLVDGYNVPMTIVPQGGELNAGNCTATGCTVELNGPCPAELKVMMDDSDGEASASSSPVGCKSACEAFGDSQYCCSGAYASPATCKPSSYSEFFKNACPTAYSYAYDDGTSTFTCSGADYVITFCPSPSASASLKSTSKGQHPEAVSFSAASPAASPWLSVTFSFSVLVAAFAARRSC